MDYNEPIIVGEDGINLFSTIEYALIYIEPYDAPTSIGYDRFGRKYSFYVDDGNQVRCRIVEGSYHDESKKLIIDHLQNMDIFKDVDLNGMDLQSIFNVAKPVYESMPQSFSLLEFIKKLFSIVK